MPEDYYDRADGNVIALASVEHGRGGGGYHEGGLKPHRKVDMNILKRNMSVAKGFMDISLLSANANQLRNLFNFGNPNSAIYYIILTGLVSSLILQLATGVILIIKERFDLNQEDDHEWCDRLNNMTVLFVFIILIVNVFVSSFGVDVMNPHSYEQHALIISHLPRVANNITNF